MGTVYEATHDGQAVAVKVLATSLAADPALRDRFRREARALSAVKHQRVVRLLSEGEDRGFVYFAMELVRGEDLRARLQRGPMPVAEVVALARAALEGLVAIHAAGVVHRDVKPANVLLGQGGPQWCDFGIARLDGSATLTESSALLGSLKYLAPEARWGKAETRSDLYSLGLVLHEALAGGVPGEKALPAGTPRWLRRFIGELTRASVVARPATAVMALERFDVLRRNSRPAVVAAAVGLFGVAAGGVLHSLAPSDLPAVSLVVTVPVTLVFEAAPSSLFVDGRQVPAAPSQVLQLSRGRHHVVYDCQGTIGLEDPTVTIEQPGQNLRFRGCVLEDRQTELAPQPVSVTLRFERTPLTIKFDSESLPPRAQQVIDSFLGEHWLAFTCLDGSKEEGPLSINRPGQIVRLPGCDAPKAPVVKMVKPKAVAPSDDVKRMEKKRLKK
jgi:hypothetical protein